MTLSEIIANLTKLSASIRQDEFVYDFLAVFGTPKATLARLKSGSVNLAAKDGCKLLNKKIYFEPLLPDLQKSYTPAEAITAAKADRQVMRNKPRFLIATDFQTLVAFDTKKNDTAEFPIAELHDHYTFFLPFAGMETTAFQAETEADVKAAEHMAKLYDLIRADNPPTTRDERHALNVFLTRLLFCYFAEDTGIFSEQLFTKAIDTYTQADGSDVAGFLRELFLTLNTETKARVKTKPHLAAFPYVNGGLFSDTLASYSAVPDFSTKSRSRLIELGTKSWKEINPDIFGSMFQGVVDDEKRAELGMHYTSVPNIMKVIRPLFLDELYEEFEKAKGSVARLTKLLNRIYRLRIFDPACGSGNFLIIAYKELRRLEMLIFKELEKSENRPLMEEPQPGFEGRGFHAANEQPALKVSQATLRLPGIHVSQFYGIELDDFAHEVAILALWLAEHQMNVEFKAAFGNAPASLPLKDGAKIVCANATLEDWEKVCPKQDGYEVFILGNPPYAGSKLQTREQKKDIGECLSKLVKYKDLDYIACWFVKAADYIQKTSSQFAFVTTNSLNQGVQVELLWPYIYRLNLEIFFAIKNFRWQNNAKNKATVTCSIIGIRNPSTAPKTLFHDNIALRVDLIGPYLVAGSKTIIGRRTDPISKLPTMDMGNQKFDGGHLVLSKEQRAYLVCKHPKIEKFIRPLVGTTEFIESNTRYCYWLNDALLDEAKTIPEIAKAIQSVAAYRAMSTDLGTQKLAARPHQFRDTKTPVKCSLLVSRTSSENRPYIPCGFLDKDVIVADAQVIYDAEPWVFAVVSSRLHYLWAKTVGGGLETRIRYSSQICWNNYPFPTITEKKRDELSKLTETILKIRESYPEKTIAHLYDPDTMPDELLKAHLALDETIEKCYRDRAKPFASDEERLEYLFNDYERMAAAENVDLLTPATVKKAKTKKAHA